ncbi:hypothetical protein Tco_0578792, partial [Tanacetum coccineum]
MVMKPVHLLFRLQNEDEVIKTERKQVEVDDQAIPILILGLLADVYAVVDSSEDANAMFTSTEGETIGNQIVGNLQGNVAAPAAENNINGHNVIQIRSYNCK